MANDPRLIHVKLRTSQKCEPVKRSVDEDGPGLRDGMGKVGIANIDSLKLCSPRAGWLGNNREGEIAGLAKSIRIGRRAGGVCVFRIRGRCVVSES